MSKEEMVQLIRQVWSDAMSDNGSIWRKSNEALRKAKRDELKAEYADGYSVMLEWSN